ncbi:MAG: hypothetical protein N3A69_02040 [Leptospiraceae bacterium]|nr:hypothetical protein [Leptospiraceae bacterium]
MKYFLLILVILPQALFGKNLFNITGLLYGLQSKSPSKEIDKTQSQSKEFEYKKQSENLLLLGVNNISHNDKYGYDFKFQLLSNGNKVKPFLGENAYIYFQVWDAHLFLGRKNFLNKKIFFEWKDGTEGIGIFYQTKNWSFQIGLLDYYRAYPILEKSFLVSSDLGKEHRFRHSAELSFENENHFLGFSFFYLNLGNWGRYSNEVLKTNSGDRDFLYEAKLQYELSLSFFQWGMGLHFLRGLDKTQSHEIRKNASLPFAGELVTTKLGFHFELFSLELRGFLPDRHKVNKQGEILESGYIGTGTYPFRGVLLGQLLEYYPSAWVKEKGLGFEENFLQGFRYSFLGEVELRIKAEDWKVSLFATNLTPYKTNGTQKGTLRANRQEFSRLFLNEYGIEFLYHPTNENIFFSLFVSTLVTSKEIGYSATLAYIKGGIKF